MPSASSGPCTNSLEALEVADVCDAEPEVRPGAGTVTPTEVRNACMAKTMMHVRKAAMLDLMARVLECCRDPGAENLVRRRGAAETITQPSAALHHG